MWTSFMDMHSGGGQKLDWRNIFIEAHEEQACIIFQNLFNRNPDRVTCTCCGPDYSYHEYPTLAEATAFDRNCRFDKTLNRYVEEPSDVCYSFGDCEGYTTLDDYISSGKCKVVYAASLDPSDYEGTLHEEGFVWKGGD